MGEIFNTLIAYGHSIDDIKWKYTIDQVYFFFEKCKKMELDSLRENAMVTANSMLLSTPVYDKRDVSKRRMAWEKFIQTLTWGSLEKKAHKKTVGDFKNMFSRVGLKVRQKKKDSDS